MSIYNNDNGFKKAQRDYDNQLPEDSNYYCNNCEFNKTECKYCDYYEEEDNNE